MKQLVKLVRLSSKEAFKKLRSSKKIYCKDLNKTFKVTNLFLRHISWRSKNRELRDVIERLSSINLIEKIWNEWDLIEVRDNIVIEWYKKFDKSYKIKLITSNIEFFIILWEKSTSEVILISVFLNYLD